jgi:hypothetical protein
LVELPESPGALREGVTDPVCDVCGLAGGTLFPPFVDGEYLEDPERWQRHDHCDHPTRVGFGPLAQRAVLEVAATNAACSAFPAP